jgi:transcriptional regulator with XRE-family HTH domain
VNNFCNFENMKIENREFVVHVPKADGSGIAEKFPVTVPVRWDEEIQDWLMTPEAHEIIENLLLPAQLKELRERHDCTQREMGELFQVGEKSWTRWETGKHRPSRSINLLIRALYEGEISIHYLLERACRPPRKAEVADVESNWLSFHKPAEMTYVVVANQSVVQIHSKSVAKPNFLEAVLQQIQQQEESPWSARSITKNPGSLPSASPKKRFEYQNVNLA